VRAASPIIVSITDLATARTMPDCLAVGDSERIIQGVFEVGGERLDKALAQASGLSRERVKALIAQGRVSPALPASTRMLAGTAWAIRVPEAAPAEAAPQAIALDVVYEDDHLIVVDKPAGLVVHPAAGNPDGTLVNALLHHCTGKLSGIGGVARPGIVHRIDKDTSGLLVVAKTDAAHEGLARQFAAHSIERAYRAICLGRPVPAAGTIRGAIARSITNRKKMALVEEGRGKPAVTHYRTLQGLDGATDLECTLETGRTHQVRVHLSSIGHPLVGDPVYGRASPALRPILARLGFKRQALHAARLGFVHPVTGQALSFASPLPVDMAALLVELGGNP
jgi:23S rRNA pseudouridine1911/1915/1917 synthase